MIYDTIIVGSGAAGLSAAVYAARAQMNFIVLDKFSGSVGQISGSSRVDNYLGLSGENGYDLGMKFRRHAESLGAKFFEGEAVNVAFDSGIYNIKLSSGSALQTRTVVYAAGTEPRKPDILGIERFSGKGVSYCAVCDGAFFKEKNVIVIGGGDSAVGDALFLSSIAKEVTLIHRRNEFRANKSSVEKAQKAPNIRFMLNAEVKELLGDSKISAVRVVQGCKDYTLDTDGVFVAIGSKPATDPIRGICELNVDGYVIASEDCTTSAMGFFAAGDVRQKPLKQLITAAADGANSIHSAELYLMRS